MQADFLLQTDRERSAPVSTLCDLFDRAVAATPEKVALRHCGAALSYREMGRAVASLARRLEAIVAPGDVVALVPPNSIEFQIAYFAALKALATPADWLLPHDLRHYDNPRSRSRISVRRQGTGLAP